MFYLPKYQDLFKYVDVIYTLDSGVLVKNNAFLYIDMAENDLRQPLFGLFALPFSVLAKFISLFFKFIPHSYNVIFNTIQILLLGISFVFLGKMINIKENQKNIFLCFLFAVIL